jgi:general secretion pathway protein N
MSRRLSLQLALALVAFVAVLVATAPASLVAWSVDRATRERIALRDVQGSAWSGAGRLYARETRGSLVDLGPVRWRARPLSVLTGALAMEIALGDGARFAAVELSPSSLSVQGLDVQLPGRVLAAIDPALETLGPDGNVRIRSDSLRIDPDAVLGLADIEWRDARLARAKGMAFGSHVARLRGGGPKVGIELATLSGPLQLKATGSWDRRGGAFSISGNAEAQGAELAGFLRSVCAEYRESRCAFRYSRGL